MLKHSFIRISKQLGVIMVQSLSRFNAKSFLVGKELFIIGVYLEPPKQNGRVERKHRHLIEIAKAIRVHAYLPFKFWGRCVLAATHIIDKLPVAVLGWQTPFERLFGKPPTYTELRVIGSSCYSLDTVVCDKFAKKGRRCIVLEYPAYQKAYTLYDLDTHQIFVSGDVKFFETILPYKTEQLAGSHPTVAFFPNHSSSIPKNSAQVSQDFCPEPMPCNSDLVIRILFMFNLQPYHHQVMIFL